MATEMTPSSRRGCPRGWPTAPRHRRRRSSSSACSPSRARCRSLTGRTGSRVIDGGRRRMLLLVAATLTGLGAVGGGLLIAGMEHRDTPPPIVRATPAPVSEPSSSTTPDGLGTTGVVPTDVPTGIRARRGRHAARDGALGALAGRRHDLPGSRPVAVARRSIPVVQGRQLGVRLRSGQHGAAVHGSPRPRSPCPRVS